MVCNMSALPSSASSCAYQDEEAFLQEEKGDIFQGRRFQRARAFAYDKAGRELLHRH
eukprot:m.726569 g.726569  ORF g.726569 m.726569 type:complete len:57 (-) comp58858_c0_seq2:33-203(-)